MISLFRNKKAVKRTAVLLLLTMFFQVVSPLSALALTGGPSQPEVQSFEPVETSEMVDLFSGDFKYNIPLLDVGGYPVNLSYNSDISMDQEASWVGLGWNVNPGVINRNMRSLPDDFKGDEVVREFNMKDNLTVGAAATASLTKLEIFGKTIEIPNASLDATLGIYYNTYTGVGVQSGVAPTYKLLQNGSKSLNFSLGISADSERGMGISPSLKYEDNASGFKKAIRNKTSLSLGLSFSSRDGFRSLTLKGENKLVRNHIVRLDCDANGIEKQKEVSSHNFGGAAASSTLNFSYMSYTPEIEYPFRTRSYSMEVKFGNEYKGVLNNTSMQGYSNTATVATTKVPADAYGYMYLGEAYRSREAMLDFNREKDGPFTENTPGLPLASLSYDVFALSGQGTGGTYRLHRGDVGMVYDKEVSSYSYSAEPPGVEFGAGSDVHSGINFSLTEVESMSRLWTGESSADASAVLHNLPFKPNTDYEPAYFKMAEDAVFEPETDLLEEWGGRKAVRFTLGSGGRFPESDEQWAENAITDGQQAPTTVTPFKREKRVPRNQPLSTLTATEAAKAGLIKEIENYNQGFGLNANKQYNKQTLNRVDVSRKVHHISQITTTTTEGARYIYGIPAYNHTQVEATFSVNVSANYFQNNSTGARNEFARNGIISSGYDAADIGTGNDNGEDHFFDATTLPAYAHSYLLTAIVSADYVDVTGNGPTDDDLGSYTKFNYTKVKDDYKWRTPYSHAAYNPGMLSKHNAYCDDKGSIIYGEKDIWYLHSIETKTHIAEFETDNRLDAWEAADYKNGGMPSGASATNTPSKLLKEIRLYYKQDRMNNSGALPLKTVHFEYDYSLCQGIPNHIAAGVGPTGKLTLKKVYFTFGKIIKGQFSAYQFTYAQNFDVAIGSGQNFEVPYKYNIKGYDRWGNYAPNELASNDPNVSYLNPLLAPFPAQESPYTTQNKMLADHYARAWKLETIELPSGGKIKVNYEADDYAYVQNKKAMRMFRPDRCAPLQHPDDTKEEILTWMAGLSQSNFNAFGKELYDNSSLDKTPYQLMFFELDEPILIGDFNIKSSFYQKKFERDYIMDEHGIPLKNLYFKFHIELHNSANNANPFINENLQEFVPGYATIAEGGYGLVPNDFGSGKIKYGWIRIEKEEIQDIIPPAINSKYVHPISQAAWNFMRLHFPKIAYDKPIKEEPDLIAFMDILLTTITDLVPIQRGMCQKLRSKESARLFFANSVIRLYNPNGKKLGGGARVKEIRISDTWEGEKSGNDYLDYEYGQQYTYTKEEGGNEISSGVASYEPTIGGDENPFRQPVFYTGVKPLAPDDRFFHETPYGEMFFPAPSVGYSQVKVRNIQREGVKRHATGWAEFTYYTAKDYPTISKQTEISADRYKTNPILSLTSIENKDYMAASQGYCVIVNDMHGKVKGEYHYNEAGEQITKMDYYYKSLPTTTTITSPKLNFPGRLNNIVKAIDAKGAINDGELGVEYDIVADSRENTTEATTRGAASNLEVIIAAIVPVPVATIWPIAIKEKTRSRTIVITKVIHQHGILDKTVAWDQGSSVATENLLYDKETGAVLLTKVTNDFNDPIYAMTFPAHWGYDRMGMAYRNQDILLRGDHAKDNSTLYFTIGDEVMCARYAAKKPHVRSVKGWVSSVLPLNIVDMAGKRIKINNGTLLKITRSGRRNLHGAPVQKIVTLENPVQNNQLVFNKVIDASAVEYSDEWGLFCKECGYDPDKVYNPFIAGTKGNWRIKRNYTYLTGRGQTRKNENTNIRKDGTFDYFQSFWRQSTGDFWNPVTDGWTFVSEATIYSPYGVELENRDALDRYSSAVYGYNFSQPVAVGQNAQYREIAFDGFEDYYFPGCNDHFRYKNHIDKTTGMVSHTGRYSIRLEGSNATVSKSRNLQNCKSQ